MHVLEKVTQQLVVSFPWKEIVQTNWLSVNLNAEILEGRILLFHFGLDFYLHIEQLWSGHRGP